MAITTITPDDPELLGFKDDLIDLAVTILRVMAGGAGPHRLAHQVAALCKSIGAYAAKYNETPWPGAITDTLCLELQKSRDMGSEELAVVTGALRMAAAELRGINATQIAAQRQMHQGIHWLLRADKLLRV